MSEKVCSSKTWIIILFVSSKRQAEKKTDKNSKLFQQYGKVFHQNWNNIKIENVIFENISTILHTKIKSKRQDVPSIMGNNYFRSHIFMVCFCVSWFSPYPSYTFHTISEFTIYLNKNLNSNDFFCSYSTSKRRYYSQFEIDSCT